MDLNNEEEAFLMSRKKVLLLEDDLTLNETIADYLDENNFEVISAYTGEEAEDLLYETVFDLLLLDVNVPSPNGFELLQAVRTKGDTTPAIFITSLNGMTDLESGFESGCDDYIRKPFALKELLLRIQSIIARNFFHNPNARLTIAKGVTYDTLSDTLFLKDEAVSLHAKEKKLLQYFLKHPDQQLSHEAIMEHLWGYDETPSDASLRTYIKNLRKILGKDTIVSIKRYGYKFSAE